MRYFNWLWRSVVFIMLLGFAVKNDQPVSLRYFFGFEWHSTLVVVLLLFFALGAVIGVLAMLGKVLQQRRDIARLRRDIPGADSLADVN